MLICPGCGKRELGKATHCSACGSVLPFKTILEMPSFGSGGSQRSCPSCAQAVPALASRCPVCGAMQKVRPDDIPTEVESVDRGGLSNVATDLGRDLTTEPTSQVSDFDDERVVTADQRPPPPTPTAQIRAVFASSPQEPASPAHDPAPGPTPRQAQKVGPSPSPDLSTLVHRPELEATIPPLAATVPEMPAVAAAPPSPPVSAGPDEARQRLDAAARAVERSSSKARVATPAIPTAAESPRPGSVAGIQVALRPKKHRPAARAAAPSAAPSADDASSTPSTSSAGASLPTEAQRSPRPAAPTADALPRQPQQPAAPDPRHEMPTRVYPALKTQPSAAAPKDVGLLGAPTLDMAVASVPAPADPCGHCGTARLPNMKFCHECGSPLSAAPASPTAASLRAVQRPATASPGNTSVPRLHVLSAGQLSGQHYPIPAGGLVLGRSQASVQIPGDPYLSSPHLRCSHHGRGLLIEDLGSRNGVFVRLRQPQKISNGTRFILGSQLFVFFDDDSARETVLPVDDGRGTRLIASPGSKQALSLVQIFDGGSYAIHRRQQRAVTLGRCHCDLNFPDDTEISERHLRLIKAGDDTVVEDLGSRNGTFVAIDRATPIEHGDEIIVGSQLMRCICR